MTFCSAVDEQTCRDVTCYFYPCFAVFCSLYSIDILFYTFIAEDLKETYRELFVWAVVFGRMPLAEIFWRQCPDQVGSALVASIIFKSLARKATSQLAYELNGNAR